MLHLATVISTAGSQVLAGILLCKKPALSNYRSSPAELSYLRTN